MKAIVSESYVFEGDAAAGGCSFSHNTKMLADGSYFNMGVLVGLSLTQGGSGIQCLAIPVYQYWTGQTVRDDLLTVQLINDYELQQKVREVPRVYRHIY